MTEKIAWRVHNTTADWLFLKHKTKNWLITHVYAKKLGSLALSAFVNLLFFLHNEQSTSIEIYVYDFFKGYNEFFVVLQKATAFGRNVSQFLRQLMMHL